MKKSFKIDSLSEGMRIDRWIRNNISNLPQGLIEKNLRKGKIKLNSKKTKSSTKLCLHDEINLFNFKFSEKIQQKKYKYKPTIKDLELNENQLIENNQNFIVINKEIGISVQGGTKSKKNLVDIFSKSEIFQNTKPYPVHRLDKDTSGILIISKNRETAKLLTTLFRLRRIHKTYLAIANGEVLEKSGELVHNLIRFEGKKKIIEKAQTFFKVIDKNSNCSLLELRPITGRKHQLRKQLYEMGHSIVGDDKYKNNFSRKIFNKELMLHAYKIKFMINQIKYNYKAIPPDHFMKTLKKKRLSF